MHTEAESVITPSLSIVVETMHGTNAAKQVKTVPLSKDAISRRIEDISSDLKSQICEHFEAPDESTYISGKAQLLAFIRFIKDEKFENEYLF